MNNSLTKICVILCLLIPFLSYSQSSTSRKGLNYGFELGWSFPSANEAKMYDCGNTSEVNLQDVLISNTTNYTNLKEYYNDDFIVYEFPSNIAYKSGLCFGGTLQYYLNETLSIFGNILYTSPTTKNGVFSIQLLSKTGEYSNEVIKKGTITGKESRFNFEIGIHKAFKTQTFFSPFVEIAAAGSYLEVKSHEIEIGSLSQSVLYYTTNSTNTTFTKFGYGTSCACGIQFPLNDKFYLYTGFSINAIHYDITNDTFSYAKAIDCKILL